MTAHYYNTEHVHPYSWDQVGGIIWSDVHKMDQTHCLQKGPYFKDLVLNKDLFGILGPYWVLIYISGSLFSLFWLHSREECQFSLHVYNNELS